MTQYTIINVKKNHEVVYGVSWSGEKTLRAVIGPMANIEVQSYDNVDVDVDEVFSALVPVLTGYDVYERRVGPLVIISRGDPKRVKKYEVYGSYGNKIGEIGTNIPLSFKSIIQHMNK